MKITTSINPLGEWTAHDSDSYDGADDAGEQPVGTGKTEREAIDDLVETMVDNAYDNGLRDGARLAELRHYSRISRNAPP
jgi:hypothetical protein